MYAQSLWNKWIGDIGALARWCIVFASVFVFAVFAWSFFPWPGTRGWDCTHDTPDKHLPSVGWLHNTHNLHWICKACVKPRLNRVMTNSTRAARFFGDIYCNMMKYRNIHRLTWIALGRINHPIMSGVILLGVCKIKNDLKIWTFFFFFSKNKLFCVCVLAFLLGLRLFIYLFIM